MFVSSADEESSSLEDKDVDDNGRKFETTTDATCDIEVKPVELLISLVSNVCDAGDGAAPDIENAAVVTASATGSAVCNLSSKEGNNIVLL